MKWSRSKTPRLAWLAYMAGRDSQLRDEWMGRARREQDNKSMYVHHARLFNSMYIFWLKKISEERSKA